MTETGAESVVVETASGKVAGLRVEGLCRFRGIPYARPPVGPLRLRAPQPPEPWSEVRDARSFGPSAPQPKLRFELAPGMAVGEQSEDCLTLNVTTPAADSGSRPVLVWIHGGAFNVGSGSQAVYDVRPLVRRGDVVVVTFNYRLGALGFLYLAELMDDAHGISANCGILDQVRALEWLRESIGAFGGDPDNVTIFGESAGGMSVATLLGLPRARGLFRRAIAQSGAAHRINRADEATAVAENLLGHLGLARSQAARLLTLPVPQLLEGQDACIQELERESARRAFCPTVDGASLPEWPLDAIRRGLSRDVDLLLGVTRDEWKLFGFIDPQARTLDEARLLARIENRQPGHGAALVAAYRSAREGSRPTDPPALFFALETDRVFRIPAIRLAEAQCAHRDRVFFYRMDWESPLLEGALGACHGVDVPFVFGTVDGPGGRLFAGEGRATRALSEKMMDAWLAFARSGDPRHPGLPEWPPYEPQRRATLIFDRQCRIEDDPEAEERRAWTGIR